MSRTPESTVVRFASLLDEPGAAEPFSKAAERLQHHYAREDTELAAIYLELSIAFLKLDVRRRQQALGGPA